MDNQSLKTVDIPIDLLVPNPDNINVQDDKTFGALVEQIREIGMIDPVAVVPMADGKYLLLGGEHRWRACKHIGMTMIPAIIHNDEKWQDKDFLDLVSFKLNNLHGSQDAEKFVKLYERMAAKYGADSLQGVFAVTDKSAWKKLTKSIQKGLAAAGVPADVIDQVDKAQEKSLNADAFAKKLGRLMQKHQASAGYTNAIVLNHGAKTMVLNVSGDLFATMEAIQAYAVASEKDMSGVLLPALHALAVSFGGSNGITG